MTPTREINAKCEVVLKWGAAKGIADQCDQPTTHAYPTDGGGFMALCEEHAKQHQPYAKPVAEWVSRV